MIDLGKIQYQSYDYAAHGIMAALPEFLTDYELSMSIYNLRIYCGAIAKAIAEVDWQICVDALTEEELEIYNRGRERGLGLIYESIRESGDSVS